MQVVENINGAFQQLANTLVSYIVQQYSTNKLPNLSSGPGCCLQHEMFKLVFIFLEPSKIPSRWICYLKDAVTRDLQPTKGHLCISEQQTLVFKLMCFEKKKVFWNWEPWCRQKERKAAKTNTEKKWSTIFRIMTVPPSVKDFSQSKTTLYSTVCLPQTICCLFAVHTSPWIPMTPTPHPSSCSLE